MKDLTIVIVTYNARDMLQTCLHSVLAETKGIDYEVVVVDNASTDDTQRMVAGEFPQIRFMRNDCNVGFAAANNMAMQESTSRFVLLLNPDTEILRGAIQKTIHFMGEHPRAGVVGCKLMYPDGRFQPSAYSFPTVWNMFAEATFLYRIFPKTKLFGSYHLTHLDFTKDQQVDWLIGAYYLIKREVIDTVGLLDEQYFMYAEDTDYCYLAKKAGFEIWFTPSAEIYHYYGGMSGLNKRVAIWTHRGQIVFYKKHFGNGKICFLICLKCFGLVLRILRYSIAGVFKADKHFLQKAGYAFYSLFIILFSRWEYLPGFKGKTSQWEI